MAIILKSRFLLDKEEAEKQYNRYMEQFNNGLIVLNDAEFAHETAEMQELETIQQEGTFAADMAEAKREAEQLREDLHRTELRTSELLDENIELRRDRNMLENRLRHFLQSEFIRSFGAKDIKTGEYARDIQEAGRIVRQSIVAIPLPERRRFCRWF